MHRVLTLALLSSAVIGCGSSANMNSMPVSFSMMEGAANEICNLVLSPGYRSSRELGTESDRFGMFLKNFMNEAEGGPYAADAKTIQEKMLTLDKLARTRAPLDKQREAAKDLQATIAALKAKM